MNELTTKQKKVLAFVKMKVLEKGQFPSLAVIAERFGISRVASKRYLDTFLAKGLIRKNEERDSYFAFNDPALQQSSTFELVADIAAGSPVHAEEQAKLISINPQFFGGGQQKLLRVSGDSMLGDQICDGDLAIIKLQKIIGKHDIAALRVEGEGITLKRVKRTKEYLSLIPSNPVFPIRRFTPEQVETIGKLVGVIRKQGI